MLQGWPPVAEDPLKTPLTDFSGVSGPQDDARNYEQEAARKAASAASQPEWVSTTVAVVLTAVLVAIASFVGTRVSVGEGPASWQDKASSLVRSVGLGSPLDTVENWDLLGQRVG